MAWCRAATSALRLLRCPWPRVTGYRESEPLTRGNRRQILLIEKVKELPLLPQRTYGQRRSTFYGLFLQHSSIARGEDDCQATGVSRSWDCTKYGIEHMIGYRESLSTDTRRPDLDPPTRQKVLVTLSLRAKAEKS